MKLHLPSLTCLLALAALAAAPFQAAADYVLSSEEELIAEYLANDPGQERPALHLDPILSRVARERAEDMAARNYFDHVNPDGWAANALVLDAGYILPSAWGTDLTNNYIESIAAGQNNAADTWADWMASLPHRTHLLALNAFYQTETSYGVGYAYSANSTYKHYWVVITAPPNVTEPNAALFISQGVPSAMIAGQTYSVSVSMLNTGSNTWTQGAGYRLAPLAGSWGTANVPVPAAVTPGSAVTFSFTVAAPAGAGSENFQWRMEQEGSGPFGEATPNRVIPVSLPAPPPPPPPGNNASSSGSSGSYSASGSSSKKSKKKGKSKGKKKKK